MDAKTLKARLDGMLMRYPREINHAQYNLIGSHDTARFLTEAKGESWRLRLAMAFQMLFPGAPAIYYGDEMGMTGRERPRLPGRHGLGSSGYRVAPMAKGHDRPAQAASRAANRRVPCAGCKGYAVRLRAEAGRRPRGGVLQRLGHTRTTGLRGDGGNRAHSAALRKDHRRP